MYGPPHYAAAQGEYRALFGGGGGALRFFAAADDVVASAGGGGVGTVVEISCCAELLGREPLLDEARNGSARAHKCFS